MTFEDAVFGPIDEEALILPGCGVHRSIRCSYADHRSLSRHGYLGICYGWLIQYLLWHERSGTGYVRC
jgi:hypothetical protein